jgi:hypothetical protein
MNSYQLKLNVERGANIAREIETLQEELKAIKKSLVTEAASRPQEHEPSGANDGTVWSFLGVEHAAVVTFPTDTLKESIKLDSKNFEQIEVLLRGSDIAEFFERVNAVRPIANFRPFLTGRVGEKTAERILKLCTTASSPKVTFKEVA